MPGLSLFIFNIILHPHPLVNHRCGSGSVTRPQEVPLGCSYDLKCVVTDAEGVCVTKIFNIISVEES